MTDKKNVYINCSEISSYINQSKWDFVTPFIRLWKRVDYDNYKYCELYNKESDKDDIVQLDKIEELKETLGEEFIKQTIVSTNNAQDMNNNIKKSVEKIASLDISDDKKAELKDNIESLVNTSFGTHNENGGLYLYQLNTNTKLNTNQIYNSKQIYSSDKYNWFVGGKVDGINDLKIVEVKTRTKCFFKELRDYENTQMQLYMYIYERDFTDLVEYLPQNRIKIKITHVKKNIEDFNKIVSNIKIFIKHFEEFLERDIEHKYDFYKMGLYDKKEYLKSLYLAKMEYI
jgi:hypothetical protein